jgi:hypothetical protein
VSSMASVIETSRTPPSTKCMLSIEKEPQLAKQAIEFVDQNEIDFPIPGITTQPPECRTGFVVTLKPGVVVDFGNSPYSVVHAP